MDLQVHNLIEDLDRQVDLLLKNQAKRPTVKGDETIAGLLNRIASLRTKLKGSSEYTRKPLMSPVPMSRG
jgi:hypothetical protein